MECHCLQILLVICIFIASGSCGGYRHHRDHDDDHHQHVGRRGHEYGEHQDPHAYFYANVHRQSGYSHHPPGHGMGHGFQHGYGMHGYGHGPYRGHYGHGFRGDVSSSDEDDHHRQHHRRRHHHDMDHHDDSSSSEEESSSEKEEEHEDQHDDRIWRFQIGDNFGAYEYLDHDGHAQGFHIDLMRAVCARAGKRCYFLIDTYHNCWNTAGGQELPGIGLMDHYYDGCIGNLPTPDRLNSFNFTLPFAPDVKCGLLYKPGTERTPAEARNVTGKKLGFVDGWALGKRCFERQAGYIGNAPGLYTPVLFETHKGMIRALLQEEIDAVLTVDAFDSNNMKMSLVEPKFSCTLGGSSVMTLYGSEVLDWWNAAFLEMKADGSFRRECERSQQAHGHKGRVACLH